MLFAAVETLSLPGERAKQARLGTPQSAPFLWLRSHFMRCAYASMFNRIYPEIMDRSSFFTLVIFDCPRSINF